MHTPRYSLGFHALVAFTASLLVLSLIVFSRSSSPFFPFQSALKDAVKVTEASGGSITTNFEAKFIKKSAGAAIVFGYYTDNDPDSFVPILRDGTYPAYASVPTLAEGGTVPFSVSDFSSLGFAIRVYSAGVETFYATKNTINYGDDNAVVYNPAANEYVISFEDLPLWNDDGDYNDMVVSVKVIDCSGATPCFTADTTGAPAQIVFEPGDGNPLQTILNTAGYSIDALNDQVNIQEFLRPGNVVGYAWSDTIGWVSFNCRNENPQCSGTNYGVNLSEAGRLSGYAWSDKVGWISFNTMDTKDCPGSGECRARLEGGNVLGWAKTINGDAFGVYDNGWGGWISLNCANTSECGTSNYKVSLSGSNFEGWAFGGEDNGGSYGEDTGVLGWISFSCDTVDSCGTASYRPNIVDSTLPTVTTFTGNSPIDDGENTTLTWSVSNATLCTGGGGWSGSKDLPSGSQVVGPLSVSTSFTLSCANAFGSSTPAIVNVVVNPNEDFTLLKSGNIRKTSIQANSSGITVTIASEGGFGSDVVLGAEPQTLGGVPVTYNFSDTALSLGEYSTGSIFSLSSTSSIPAGQYTITITGVGGGISKTLDILFDAAATSSRSVEEF